MATTRSKEQEEIVREVLGIQPILIGSFFTLLILSFLLLRYFTLLTCLWSSLIGFGLAYLVLCNFPQLPSLLLILYKPREKVESDSSKGGIALNICSVCQKLKCQSHTRPDNYSEIDLEPWRNLKLNQAVDNAIQEFLDLLLENYVYHWYREKLSSDERFIDELRTSFRFIFAVIFRRLKKIDIPTLILNKLVKNGLQHLESYLKVRRKIRAGSSVDFNDIQALVFEELGENLHIALHSRSTELEYQRQLCGSLLPFLLPSSALQSRSTCGLFRELLVYSVFTAGIDKISEPDFVNQILLVLLDEESMEEPLEPLSEEVEFLAKFSKPKGKVPFHALCLTMPTIINTPSVLFHFIRFMENQASLNILQFCLTLEDFNKRCLGVDLTEEDEKGLHKETKTIYNKYFVKGAPDLIPFDKTIVESLKKVVNSSSDQMTNLEMATPLYRAYEYVFDLLEHIYLPLFHQSDKYFNMICGTKDSDKPTMKPPQKVSKRKLEPLGKKLVNSLKDLFPSSKSQDGLFKVIEAGPFELVEDNYVDIVDNDNVDMHPDLELRDNLPPVRDMSQWVISIPKGAFVQNGSKELLVVKQGPIEHDYHDVVSYIISVCESESNENMSRWDVKRQHHEFYVLHNKLREFHGFFGGPGLPPKRNSTLSSRQAIEIFEKYQNSFKHYLQDLVRNPLTQGSALLYNFLSPDAEFTNMFTPDTVGQVAGKKLKSVATMLKKEKGQNLETFLHSFLVSTIPTSGRNSPISGSPSSQRKEYRQQSASTGKQNLVGGKSNKDVSDGMKQRQAKTRQDPTQKPKPILQLKGMTDYILYLAVHLLEVPTWCLNLLLCFQIVGQRTFDDFADRYLAYKIRLVQHEYHLVPIINMFRDTIFFDDDPPRTDTEKMERRDRALKQLLNFFPAPLMKFIGKQKYIEGLNAIFELLQHPQLNKQLTYTLLDTLVLELFPEINQVDTKDED